MSIEYRALPMKTLNDPKGNPYLSVIDCNTFTRIQLHDKDNLYKRGAFLSIDRRSVPALIKALEELYVL